MLKNASALLLRFLFMFWRTRHYTAYKLILRWVIVQNPLYIEETKNSHPLTATKYPGLPIFSPQTTPAKPSTYILTEGRKKQQKNQQKKMELCF